MKTFVCIALLAACALAASAPEAGRRDKRSYLGPGLGYSAYSLGALVSHEPLLYSAPAAVIHEPAIVSVKKIVTLPRLVSVRKVVSYPHVARLSHVARVSHYVAAPRVSYSYAPAYSSGWW